MSALVSVIIPCHNAAPWLRACLESVAAQTWRPLEVVVVDDGSTDASAQIAEHFFAAQPIGRVVKQTQAGAAAARQRGLELAAGDLLQYLDADDLLHPEKVAAEVRRLEASPRSVASGKWIRFQDEHMDASAAPTNWRDFTPVDYVVETFDEGGMMHPAAWLVPRTVANAAGPWNAALSLDDDGEYFTRVVLAAQDVVFCPEAVSYYRSNLSGSLSGRRDRRAWESAYEVCRSSTTALMSREDSARTRRACARYWLRLAFAAYPEGGDIVARALAQARALDPAASVAHGGKRFQILAGLVGWRCAKRLQRLLR